MPMGIGRRANRQAARSRLSLSWGNRFPPPVQRRQSHRSNFPPSVLTLSPLSKTRQKTQALLCLLPVAQRTRGCPPALTVTTEEQHSETKPIRPYGAKCYCLCHACSGKTSLSGFTKDSDLKNEAHEIFTITVHDNEFSEYLYAIHTHV